MLSVVSYLIATAIWSYRLRRPADWAWRSVANADAPLAYELATALACRAHLDVSSLRNELEPFESLQLFMSGRGYGGGMFDARKTKGGGISHIPPYPLQKKPPRRDTRHVVSHH